MTPQRKPVA
jgi:Dullard-like phosphatase family protein